jgi:hypothetical protein
VEKVEKEGKNIGQSNAKENEKLFDTGNYDSDSYSDNSCHNCTLGHFCV